MKTRWRERVRSEFVAACVAFATVGSFIVVPRPTYPSSLPLPHISAREQEKRESDEVALARAALTTPLDKRVRAIGEQMRRVGMIMSRGAVPPPKLIEDLRADFASVAEKGNSDDLLKLRALQAELFLAAVRVWKKELARDVPALAPERARALEVELDELGGNFRKIAAESWLDQSRKLIAEDDELRLFFRMRWNLLTGASETPKFAPTPEEKRRYYRTNLLHPLAAGQDLQGRAEAQIKYARALHNVDPDYPVHLASGILFLRMGSADAAASELRRHLLEQPGGAWSNVARNHLLFALRQAELERQNSNAF